MLKKILILTISVLCINSISAQKPPRRIEISGNVLDVYNAPIANAIIMIDGKKQIPSPILKDIIRSGLSLQHQRSEYLLLVMGYLKTISKAEVILISTLVPVQHFSPILI